MAATADSDVETIEVEETVAKTPKKRGRASKAGDRPGPKSKKSPAKKSSKGKKTERSVVEGMRKSNRGGKPIELFQAPSNQPKNPYGKRRAGGGGGKGKSYVVEKILEKRTTKTGIVKYLLKWKDYPKSEATWESAEHGNFTKLINKFNEENGSDDDDQDWEVEKILDKRVSRGKTEYLLKWKNYPVKQATWEPSRSGNFKDLIKEYEANKEEEEEYVVEKVLNKRMRGGKAEYLLKWKGYAVGDATWEAADDGNFQELIKEYDDEQRQSRVEKAGPASSKAGPASSKAGPASSKAGKRKSTSAVNGSPKKKSKGKAGPKSRKGGKKGKKSKPAEDDQQEEEEEQPEDAEATDEAENETDGD